VLKEALHDYQSLGGGMIEDVSKTIKAILYDRISSPLFGTFLLSWCGWNWRLIFLFLTDSSTKVAAKFQYVDTALYPSNSVTFVYGFLLPATTTAFFLYIYPRIARVVYGHWREEQNRLKNLQIEKDGETPLKQEEAREIKAKHCRPSFVIRKSVKRGKLELEIWKALLNLYSRRKTIFQLAKAR